MSACENRCNLIQNTIKVIPDTALGKWDFERKKNLVSNEKILKNGICTVFEARNY